LDTNKGEVAHYAAIKLVKPTKKLTIQPLVEYFKNYLPLNKEEVNLLASRVTQRQIKRRQMILQEGFVCKHYSFVEKGCFKMYGIDEKFTAHNLRFAAENDWIADLGSFYSEKPSKLFIEAIEPSTILQIEKQDLLYLFTNVPKFDRNFRVIVEEKFIELQNRLLQSFSLNAHQRYLGFLEQYQELALKLPNTQIASYLGITPEFLSRIRGEKSSK
jgi:CRP-like cAMP-binding protein